MHLLKLGITQLLHMEVSHWLLVFQLLALLTLGWTIQGPGIGIQYHLASVLWRNCCTILLSSQPLMVLLFPVLVIYQIPSFSGSCSMCVLHLGDAQYGFVTSLTCKGNLPLKHPIPVNSLLYLPCNSSVIFTLTILSASLSGPTIKYSTSWLILLPDCQLFFLNFCLFALILFHALIYLFPIPVNVCPITVDA